MDSHTGAHGYYPETLTSMVTFFVSEALYNLSLAGILMNQIGSSQAQNTNWGPSDDPL